MYSPHTAFDSAAAGINQRLATGLGLRGVVPLAPHAEGQGAGRWGWLEEPLALCKLAGRVQDFLAIERLQLVGDSEQTVRTVAVACGAAGELLDAARSAGCDCMVLGETRFHTCLEAEACGLGLILPGHFASERFAVECLADGLVAAVSRVGDLGQPARARSTAMGRTVRRRVVTVPARPAALPARDASSSCRAWCG